MILLGRVRGGIGGYVPRAKSGYIDSDGRLSAGSFHRVKGRTGVVTVNADAVFYFNSADAGVVTLIVPMPV